MEALRAAGQEVMSSKEPTNGKWGQLIRGAAANGRPHLVHELRHFVLDRKEHIKEKIQPALDADKIVVLDRYFYSTIAYQGARLDDWTNGALQKLDRIVSKRSPIPDAVFVLDVPAEVGLIRIAESRGDVPNHFETSEALEVSRRIFNRMGELEQGLLWKVNGQDSIEDVHQTILSVLLHKTLREKRCAKEYGCEDPFHCAPRLAGQCEWWNLQGQLFKPGASASFSSLLSPAPELFPATLTT